MQFNQSTFPIQSWSLENYQFLDFIQNRTIFCPLKSNWIHFEEYFFTAIGLSITVLITIKIHLIEIRFQDYYALYRYHILNLSLILLFLASLLFNLHPNETTCKYEQILIQYSSTILLTNVFLISFFRILDNRFPRKSLLIILTFLLSFILQTLLSTSWIYLNKKNLLNYHHRTCFHRIQIDLCVHARQPLLFSTGSLPFIFLLTAWNVYRFTKPFAIAQLLEAIISAIGLLMSGSMWYMNLFFSNYPQMPYRYVAYVFLLTYMLPRVWISELERSRITVEEVKPLLHDEVQFQNGNCTIRFNDDEEEDELDIPFSLRNNQSSSTANHSAKPIIRTSNMSPGAIFSSILDKYDTKPGGCL